MDAIALGRNFLLECLSNERFVIAVEHQISRLIENICYHGHVHIGASSLASILHGVQQLSLHVQNSLWLRHGRRLGVFYSLCNSGEYWAKCDKLYDRYY